LALIAPLHPTAKRLTPSNAAIQLADAGASTFLDVKTLYSSQRRVC